VLFLLNAGGAIIYYNYETFFFVLKPFYIGFIPFFGGGFGIYFSHYSSSPSMIYLPLTGS
jgi:hypothetical protein